MLTVDDARLLLGTNCPMTDEEIAAMLDQLQQITALAFEAVAADEDRPTPGQADAEGLGP